MVQGGVSLLLMRFCQLRRARTEWFWIRLVPGPELLIGILLLPFLQHDSQGAAGLFNDSHLEVDYRPMLGMEPPMERGCRRCSIRSTTRSSRHRCSLAAWINDHERGKPG